ncbi:hypothetical protein B0H13DRAFT_1859885 [Mycena leptocephala]|nr:hypothetical protein B0H13DRAFT_1859885 [Mycena leptocephala]
MEATCSWLSSLPSSRARLIIEKQLLPTFAWDGPRLRIGDFVCDRIALCKLLSLRQMSDQLQGLLLGLIQHQFSHVLSTYFVLIGAEMVTALEKLSQGGKSNIQLDKMLLDLGERDLTGFWFEGSHWHPFTTERSTRRIGFGDSVQEANTAAPLKMSPRLKHVLDWFFDHFPLDNCLVAVHQMIPIRTSRQILANDSISCGLLAWDGLRAFLAERLHMHQTFHLVEESADARSFLRVTTAMAILIRSGSVVGPDLTVNSTRTLLGPDFNELYKDDDDDSADEDYVLSDDHNLENGTEKRHRGNQSNPVPPVQNLKRDQPITALVPRRRPVPKPAWRGAVEKRPFPPIDPHPNRSEAATEAGRAEEVVEGARAPDVALPGRAEEVAEGARAPDVALPESRSAESRVIAAFERWQRDVIKPHVQQLQAQEQALAAGHRRDERVFKAEVDVLEARLQALKLELVHAQEVFRH